MSSDDVYGDDYKNNNFDELNGSNNNDNGDKISNLLSMFVDEDNNKSNDVRIVNTEERKGKITKYTVYVIESSIFSSTTSVARRYNDFKWLYTMLGQEFVGVFIPPLPPSNLFERFNSEIISQRRYDLERFLNRISSSKILSKSPHLELFLCEQQEQIYEEQKKVHKKEQAERSDFDVISLLNTSFNNIESTEIPSHLTGGNDDDNDGENTYVLDMPRLREFFMRCDERFGALNKITSNLFKIMTNITSELQIFNQSLSELYDAEYNDRPQFMINECQQRFDIRDFMEKWKAFSENQMNCYYKYFLLSLRYEHEDIKSILDTFKRYDVVYNRYKKSKNNLKKLKEKNPDKDFTQNDEDLLNNKNLLDFVCKIVLIQQTPQIWNEKIKNYNKSVQAYINKITQQ